MGWPAQAAGPHALVVVLEGTLRTKAFQASATASAPSPLHLLPQARSRDLLALGDDVQVLRVDILHVGGDQFVLAQRRRQIDLSEPLQPDRLCR